MRAQPVDLIGGFYTDDTLPWACQDTLNWLPFRAEVAGTRTAWKLSTAPGLRDFLNIADAPIRGLYNCEGTMFVVQGQTLYRVRGDRGVDALGLIPGNGRVSMSHNQFSTGNQLLVENGQGGGGYVFTTSTNTFAKITDPAYPGSISSDYLDSYLLGVEPLGRFWFHSNLADATDYNSLDRYESEASPDRIVGLAVSQFEVVVFNQTTIEFFYNSGSATGTFQNRRQSTAQGCASRYTIAKLDNTLFWLGDDGVVYRMNGYSAQPVSTRVIDRAIAEFNWAEALAFTWEDRGHKVYCLTFPDGLTFCYDVVTGLWTRRGSYGLDRWRLSHAVKWSGKWYGGDFREGRLWRIEWDYCFEGRDPLVRRRVSPVLSDNQSALQIPFAELVFSTGDVPTTPQDELAPAQQHPEIGSITGSLPAWHHYDPYAAQLSYASVSQLTSVSFYGGDKLPPGATISLDTGNSKINIAIPGTDDMPKNPLRISIRARDTLGRFIAWTGNLAIVPWQWDGTWTFTAAQAPIQSGAWFGMAENPAGRLVQVNSTGTGFYRYSDDGALTWTQGSLVPGLWARAVAYGNGVFITASTVGCNRSANGTTWTNVYSSDLGGYPALIYAPSQIAFYCMSDTGVVRRTTNNGTSWTTMGTIPGSHGQYAQTALAWIESTSTLVAFTFSGIYTSTDNGATWTQRLAVAGSGVRPGALCYSSELGRIVACNSGGSSWYSSATAITWTSTGPTVPGVPVYIPQLPGFLIANRIGGGSSNMAYSLDGTSWSSTTYTAPNGRSWSGAIWSKRRRKMILYVEFPTLLGNDGWATMNSG